VEHDREQVKMSVGGFPAVATGVFLRGGLQVIGGLATGPPVVAFEEGKGVKHSIEQKSVHPFIDTQKKMGVGIYEGIKEDVTNPRENFGFLLLDAWGAGALLRGGHVRLKSGKPLKKPRGGRIAYTRGNRTEHETGSVNMLANDLQRLKANWVNRRMAERMEHGRNTPVGARKAAPGVAPPGGLLSVTKPRWLADSIDNFLDNTLRAHLSGERKMGRLTEHRRRVERALAEAPIAQLEAVDHMARLQERLNKVHLRVPGLTVGQQKALQVRFWDLEGDDISKLRQLREYHQDKIDNAGDVAEHLGFDRAYGPTIAKEHRAQLQALDMAEKVLKGKPSKRMQQAEALARELEQAAVEMKIREMGLPEALAEGRIAKPGVVVRTKKPIAKDDLTTYERVSPDSIYTKFESRARSKKAAKDQARLTAGPRVGAHWMPAQDPRRLVSELHTPFLGKSLDLGDFRIDTTRLIAESTAKTFRGGAKIREWQLLLDSATDKPTGSGFDIPIADGTAKNIPLELKKVQAQVNEGLIDADGAEYLARTDDQALIEHLFPGTDPHTGNVLLKGPIAGVKWVDRRMVGGLNVLPQIPDTTMRKVGQIVNEPPRALTLFARIAYGLNAGSNAQMLFHQQPVWMINNMVRALYPERFGGYSKRTVRDLDSLGDEGQNLALVNLDVHSRALLAGQTMAQLWHKLVDGWMRRAAIIHEIQFNTGLKGEKGFREFFDSPKYAQDRVEVAERGQAAMIKFSNLTEYEKQNFRNILFIYPFRSRGVVWSLRTLRDHPAQAAIFATLGDEYKDELAAAIEKHVPDQLQEAIGKWFEKTGFMPSSWDEDGNPTVFNPTGVNTFSLLHDTVNFWDSPSAVLRDLGFGAKLAVFSATGRDEYGNELPGPRIIDAFAKIFEDLPQVRAYRRGGKAALQKPLPAMDKSSREQMVSRRRKAMEQVVLGPGWMNGFGTLVSGGLTKRDVNVDAIFARFWRDLPPVERHKIEMEFLQDALVVQAKFMKKPLPDEVGKAVAVVGRETRLRSERQSESAQPLSPRANLDVTLDVLEEMKLIPPDDLKAARKAADKIKIEDEYTEMRKGFLNQYGHGKALDRWDDDVRNLWGFRKNILQRKLELAGHKQKLTQTQNELFDVGRKYVAYLDEWDRRKKLIDMEPDSHEKHFLDADLEAWREQQKPVKGIDFNRVYWTNKPEHERQEHLRSVATGEWQHASKFDKETLGKKPVDGDGWATYYQAIAAYYRDKAFDDPDLKADQRLGLAKSVNKLFPGFIRDWDFAAKRRFARLRELKPVRDSKNKADWLWLLGQAEAFSQAIDSGSVTEKDAKEQWKDAVPQLREWIADNSPAFDRELLVYEKQRKTFLQGLLEKGRP
jgi:hypothetical protein